MRYKFRGKRFDNGEWVYGSYIKILDCEDPAADELVDVEKHFIQVFTHNDYAFDHLHKVDPETVGQYTGLKDKNGKEIYEGDIIKSIRGYKAVVEWADDGRFLGFTLERERKIMYVGQEPAVEAMGNIHDNPELLEVKA